MTNNDNIPELTKKLKDSFEKHPNKANRNFSQTYLLSRIIRMGLDFEQDKTNLKNIVSKQQYFAVLYDILENTIFEDIKK